MCGYLDINSIRNKFEPIKDMLHRNLVDILLVILFILNVCMNAISYLIYSECLHVCHVLIMYCFNIGLRAFKAHVIFVKLYIYADYK